MYLKILFSAVMLLSTEERKGMISAGGVSFWNGNLSHSRKQSWKESSETAKSITIATICGSNPYIWIYELHSVL